MSEGKISGQLGCSYCYRAGTEIVLWLIGDHNQYLGSFSWLDALLSYLSFVLPDDGCADVEIRSENGINASRLGSFLQRICYSVFWWSAFFVLWRVKTEGAEFQSEQSWFCTTLANRFATYCDKISRERFVFGHFGSEKHRCMPTREDIHVVEGKKRSLVIHHSYSDRMKMSNPTEAVNSGSAATWRSKRKTEW